MSQSNRDRRKAALAAAIQLGEGPVEPVHESIVPDQGADYLEEAVTSGFLLHTVGQLIEQARKARGLGKRELARKLATTHSRISRLEQSENLELRSLLAVAQALGYDLSIGLIPREGGPVMGTVIKR
jgi:hypothetical protein